MRLSLLPPRQLLDPPPKLACLGALRTKLAPKVADTVTQLLLPPPRGLEAGNEALGRE